jgi:hypothetical protein
MAKRDAIKTRAAPAVEREWTTPGAPVAKRINTAS